MFVAILIGLTSAGACLAGARLLGVSRASLLPAGLRALEFVGISTAFFVVNVGLGLAIVLAVRGLTRGFLSAYVLGDSSLVLLSALQGLVFECWREKSGASRRAR